MIKRKHKANLAEAYLRWRHRRGFGVHSPFAYQIIKHVVAPGRDVAYYGYHDIDDSMETMHMNSRRQRLRMEARMLLRLAVELRATTVAVDHDCQEPFTTALRSAHSSMKIEDITCAGMPDGNIQLALLTCVRNVGRADCIDPLQLACIKAFLAKDGTCALIRHAPRSLCEELFADFDGGLLLCGRHFSLLFHRREMAPVSYLI